MSAMQFDTVIIIIVCTTKVRRLFRLKLRWRALREIQLKIPKKFPFGTSGGIHLHDLAPGQHSSEKIWQRQRGVGDTVSI